MCIKYYFFRFKRITVFLPILAFFLYDSSVYAQDLSKEDKSKQEAVQPKTKSEDSSFNLYQVITLGMHSITEEEKAFDAFKIDYGLWFDFERIIIELQFGVTRSLSGYEKSDKTDVNSYWWYRSDNLIHIPLYKSKISLSLGGGLGLRYLSEEISSSYTEGSFLRISSYENKKQNDFVISWMTQFTLMYYISEEINRKKALLLDFSYEFLQAPDTFKDIDILSVNFGFAF